MSTGKTSQLQIRVSPAQKKAIRQAAQRAGIDMSAYVIARLLPAPAAQFQELTSACADPEHAVHRLAGVSWLRSPTRIFGGFSRCSTTNCAEPRRKLREHGRYDVFLELDHLRVMVAQPEYLLAMKCLALRIGEASHDEDDVRYLLRHLAMGSYEQAVAVITRFYPLERFPQKTLYALAELPPQRSPGRI